MTYSGIETGRSVSIWMNAELERKLTKIQQVDGISRSAAILKAVGHLYDCRLA